jgi:hypothetical protein
MIPSTTMYMESPSVLLPLHSTKKHGNHELASSIFLYLKKQLNQSTPNPNKGPWYMVRHPKIKRNCYSKFRNLHVIVRSHTTDRKTSTQDEQYMDYGMFISSVTI